MSSQSISKCSNKILELWEHLEECWAFLTTWECRRLYKSMSKSIQPILANKNIWFTYKCERDILTHQNVACSNYYLAQCMVCHNLLPIFIHCYLNQISQEFDLVLLHIVTFMGWGHTYVSCKLSHRRERQFSYAEWASILGPIITKSATQ